MEIAYGHLAARGFEGLRVRDVAREAGVTHATLHHYFPTKEALVRSIVAHLIGAFSTPRVAPANWKMPGPLAAVRDELDDLRERLRDAPETFVVLTELVIRSRRDDGIKRILEGVDAAWHGHLAGLLQRGVDEGAFRKDLDVDGTATTLMAQLKGVALHAIASPDGATIDRIVHELGAQLEGRLLA